MPRFARPHIILFLIVSALIAQWGCLRSDRRRRTTRPPTVKIALDPGHGGKDAGASVKGVPPEKELVLDIALQVEQLLKQQRINVILTRKGDEFISLSRRARIANDGRAALFVSIHVNSCPRADVRGFEIYYAENGRERESLRAAEFVQRSLKRATNALDRGLRKRSYSVLYQTRCPSVLVEVGYLSNEREARLLSQPSHRKRVAEGIAKGILAYITSRGG